MSDDVPQGGGDDQRERLSQALGDAFTLGRLLGRGGFADVYEAQDLRLKRAVAIKVLRPDVASPSLVARFRREAEAAAQLRHPHIVPIYSVGEAAGIAWIVMPLIEGESLRQRLDREGSLPVTEAWRITREVAGALAAAHRRGIVHRDIKPDNIMLDGDERRALVMDFGIAKAMDGSETALTGTGMVVGTAHYMSPEQATGERNLDHRSDQYALATVTYQMLTGRVPFDGDSFQTIVYKQVSEAPVPVQDVNPGVPDALARTVTRALAKARTARFDSSEEFLRALDEARPADAAGAASGGPTTNIAERLSPTVRRAALALGVGGLALYLVLHGQLNPWTAPRTRVTRGEALAAARAFLVQHGATGFYDESALLHGNDSLRSFLHYAMGPRAGARWSDSLLTIRHWHVWWSRPGQNEQWQVQIGTNGAVTHFSHQPDTVTREAPAPSPADREAAEKFLSARGWDRARLEWLGDSALVARGAGRSYLWAVAGDSVVAPDITVPARHRLRVDVRDARVTGFREELVLPAAFRGGRYRINPVLNRAQDFAIVIVLALPIIAAIVRLARGPGQQLRWKGAAAVATVACVAGLISLMMGWPRFAAGNGRGEAISEFTLNIAPFFFLGPLGVLVTAIADDMARSTFPGSTAGVVELAQGRWRTSSVALAWMTSYAVAAAWVWTDAATNWWTAQAGAMREAASVNGDLFDSWVPVSSFAVGVAGSLAAVFVGLAIAGALHSLTRRRLWLTAVLGGVLITAAATQGLYAWTPNVVYAALFVGLFVACLTRLGLLALFFGLVTATCVSGAAQLLGSAQAGYLGRGLFVLSFAAVPAVLGLLAGRQQPLRWRA